MGCTVDCVGELGRELAEDEVLAPGLDETEHRSIPEAGCAPDAEDDLISGRQGEHLVESSANGSHDRPDAILTMARAHVRGTGDPEFEEALRPDL